MVHSNRSHRIINVNTLRCCRTMLEGKKKESTYKPQKERKREREKERKREREKERKREREKERKRERIDQTVASGI
jgi:hypothetical protein